ncbi:hypothetical protein DK45_4214 [Bordetella bronchiseptica]|nr:hypothetical protein DK45_4214 [Bordetella bronchiseptica]
MKLHVTPLSWPASEPGGHVGCPGRSTVWERLHD